MGEIAAIDRQIPRTEFFYGITNKFFAKTLDDIDYLAFIVKVPGKSEMWKIVILY
jgi:hypothetical protein